LIEQALFFAIGFLVASLAAVIAVPVISRRAMRLAEARARLRAPITEKQAIAERDALRAVHAVEQARLERRLALAEDASIGLRTAVGQQSAKIIALEADAKEHKRVIFDQRAEIDKGASKGRDLKVALAASETALHDAFAQRDRAQTVEAAVASRQSELEAEASRDRARIAILAARVENLQGQLEGLTSSTKTAAERANRTAAQLVSSLASESGLARELEERLLEAMSRNQRLTESLSRADAEHEESVRRLADLESRLQLSERLREETLIENGRQLAALADQEAALKTALAETAELESGLAAVNAEARAHESAASLRAQILSTAHSAMEGSLQAARADRETLQRENEALRARIAALGASVRDAPDDTRLRESIKRLGREVRRLFSAQKSIGQDDRGPEGRPPFNRQDADAPAGPPNPEARGFAEGPRRRVARSHAPDR
jgi:chromosome segregation ATPase